jgi:nucleotide-binding universal stress UspA family protein
MPARKILVAVDESPASRDCVNWTVDKLVGPKDEVHIVSVLDPGRINEVIAAGESAYPVDSDCKPNPLLLEQRCQLLKTYKEKFAPVDCDVKLATLVTCTGSSTEVGRQISRYAKEQDADLVVMGSRGMGAAASTVMGIFGLGSCSEFVVRHSPNVLVHRYVPGHATV